MVSYPINVIYSFPTLPSYNITRPLCHVQVKNQKRPYPFRYFHLGTTVQSLFRCLAIPPSNPRSVMQDLEKKIFQDATLQSRAKITWSWHIVSTKHNMQLRYYLLKWAKMTRFLLLTSCMLTRVENEAQFNTKAIIVCIDRFTRATLEKNYVGVNERAQIALVPPSNSPAENAAL